MDILNGKTFHSVITILEVLFDKSIRKSFPILYNNATNNISVEITKVTNSKFGNYQCNNAMALFKILKVNKSSNEIYNINSPKSVGEMIINNIQENEIIEKLEIAGPGFINIFFKKNFVNNRLMHILYNNNIKAHPLSEEGKNKKQKIAVDFSSPNIAKDMHVGHLRSTIIGDAMSRIFEFQGHSVYRINHLGDWGTQFGMLICHLMDTFPNWYEVTPDITDLTLLYKEAKKRFDQDEVFKARSREQVVQLQSQKDEKSTQCWQLLCNISRKEFQKVYDRLNVTLDEYGESFYNNIIPDILTLLEKKAILVDSNGAKVVFTDKYKQPFMMVKSDGSYLYDTTDLACLWYRFHVLKVDRIVYYTDYTQSDHFGLLFEVAKMADFYDDTKQIVNHIGFGTVNDETGKRFKTRSGDVVRLVDLLDEAKNKMKNILIDRIQSGQTSLPFNEVDYAAEKIGYGAVKYFDLRQSPTSNYVFSYDRMLSTNGDTAVYLLFAYARLSSIIKKSKVDILSLIENNNSATSSEIIHVSLNDPAEWGLASELLHFQDIIILISKDMMSNRLCSYLYNLADKVATFVTVCRVIGSETQNERLLLAKATLIVMKQCFQLLGIDPLDQI